MQEPGLDRHEWESELESLREGLQDAPAHALPELADLVGRMLAARGFEEGGEPEVVAPYRAARDTADRCEAGLETGAGDIAQAVDDLLAVYDHLNAERPAP